MTRAEACQAYRDIYNPAITHAEWMERHAEELCRAALAWEAEAHALRPLLHKRGWSKPKPDLCPREGA